MELLPETRGRARKRSSLTALYELGKGIFKKRSLWNINKDVPKGDVLKNGDGLEHSAPPQQKGPAVPAASDKDGNDDTWQPKQSMIAFSHSLSMVPSHASSGIGPKNEIHDEGLAEQAAIADLFIQNPLSTVSSVSTTELIYGARTRPSPLRILKRRPRLIFGPREDDASTTEVRRDSKHPKPADMPSSPEVAWDSAYGTLQRTMRGFERRQRAKSRERSPHAVMRMASTPALVTEPPLRVLCRLPSRSQLSFMSQASVSSIVTWTQDEADAAVRGLFFAEVENRDEWNQRLATGIW